LIAAASFLCGVIATLFVGYVVDGATTSNTVVLKDIRDTELGDKFHGQWKIDDLRTPSSDDGQVTFTSSGKYLDDDTDTFDTRWFCCDGMIYFVSRSTDIRNDRSHMFPLVPVFDNTGNTVTLSPPGASPRVTMTKATSAS